MNNELLLEDIAFNLFFFSGENDDDFEDDDFEDDDFDEVNNDDDFDLPEEDY
ncbi:MAG: hypothetical protein JXR30_01905 [Alphaproteobacteria bacterium]|nr:hypothetical protein [Alphaproteobacteria bacterium]